MQLPSSHASETDSSFPARGIAKEMRHLMRQGKCHACWRPLLIRLKVGHAAFDHEAMTDLLGHISCSQYQWVV